MKGWLKQLGLFAVAGFLSLILLESLLFVFNDQVFRSSFYIFDPELGFKVRPYAEFGNDQANEFGFNDRDYPHRREPGTYRILLLGDSFNWIGGREKNYGALLERLFEDEFGTGRVEVVNGGYSQTHTAEQLALLKKFGLQYSPDLVILSVFLGNDFYDADPNRKRVAFGGGLTDVVETEDFYAVLFDKPILMKSRLVIYLQERWHSQLRRRVTDGRKPDKESTEPRGGIQPQLLEGGFQPLTRYYLNSLSLRTQFNDPEYFDDFEPNVTLISESIEAMQLLLSERGIEFSVALFPDEIDVDPAVRSSFLQHYQLESVPFEWGRAGLILRKLCSERGIPFFDLSPALVDATRNGTKLYLPSNGHWNDAGNQLASRILYGALSDLVRSELARASQP